MNAPVIRLPGGREVRLGDGITSVGRDPQMTVRLDDPTVSGLHAELVRRGPYVYVEDLGLSRNGTWVNGRPIARRMLADGDRICFGAESCRISLPVLAGDGRATGTLVVTPRQRAVLEVLCRPITEEAAFTEPLSVQAIARELGISQTVARVHLDRLAVGLAVPKGALSRIANEAVERGLIGNSSGSGPAAPAAGRARTAPHAPVHPSRTRGSDHVHTYSSPR